MAVRRALLSFWWRCIKIAHSDSAAFGNDWQWLIGVPVFTIVWQHLTPLASAALVVIKGHPVLDAMGQAAIAFTITYTARFALLLVRAPFVLFERERAHADGLEAALAANDIEAARTAAMYAQASELRGMREHRERESDPYIRAFNESKYKDVLSGVAAEEHVLGFVVWWLANRTAWGRWYAAQTGTDVGDKSVLRVAESVLLTDFEKGLIPTRGIRVDAPEESEFIQPGFWQRVYFQVFPDTRSLLRARIFSRKVTSPTDTDDAVDRTYAVVFCDLLNIEKRYPQSDRMTDKETAQILAGRQLNNPSGGEDNPTSSISKLSAGAIEKPSL
ncbi:MAG: hypothetical protein ACJ8R9_17220 [Steroidobacteraceae bacterium]